MVGPLQLQPLPASEAVERQLAVVVVTQLGALSLVSIASRVQQPIKDMRTCETVKIVMLSFLQFS